MRDRGAKGRLGEMSGRLGDVLHGRETKKRASGQIAPEAPEKMG